MQHSNVSKWRVTESLCTLILCLTNCMHMLHSVRVMQKTVLSACYYFSTRFRLDYDKKKIYIYISFSLKIFYVK